MLIFSRAGLEVRYWNRSPGSLDTVAWGSGSLDGATLWTIALSAGSRLGSKASDSARLETWVILRAKYARGRAFGFGSMAPNLTFSWRLTFRPLSSLRFVCATPIYSA